jgi:hypothetical protein
VWQVVLYNHPLIRVRHKDGETADFTVSDDGTVQHGGARFDLGEARRAAIAFLARRPAAVQPT